MTLTTAVYTEKTYMEVSNTEQVLWYYDSSNQPSTVESSESLTPQWVEYRDIDADIIEDAYQAGSDSVCLDRYRIDLKNFIQIRRDDESKRRSVKRDKASNSSRRIRHQRFNDDIPILTLDSTTSAIGASDSWCPFLRRWLDTPLGKRVLLDFQACIEPCAQGIIQEAAHDPEHRMTHAVYMATKLRQYSGRSRREVTELCMRFYTRDSFLYRVLNQALREFDLTKLETLGPYVYLLSNHIRKCKPYRGSVYRGMQLTPDQIEEYRMALGEWRSWSAYASASRDFSVAEPFGTTLFIIEITGSYPTSPRGFDISWLSQYPDEAEILIPPGTSFRIVSVDQDSQGEYIIRLRI